MASDYNPHHLDANSPPSPHSHPPPIDAISLHIRAADDHSGQDELLRQQHLHQHHQQQQSHQPISHKRTSNNSYLLETKPSRTLNDAHLILSRRLNVSSRSRKDLELMCEEKVSKHKLEEVHCSLPSSNKSTFIMTFSPDGQRVASTHGDHRIYICDLNTGKLLDTLEGHPKTPWCLAWHPSNKDILASGCLAGEVRVWDLRSRACESWTSENNTIITSLDFHPRERILVIATANDIHFWDWSETEPFAKSTTTHDKEKVKFVEFDSSGTKLITGISNLPKYAGYNDSLQNRIFDSYLTQGTLEPIPTQDNMTQNSERTGQANSHLNSNNTNNNNNNNNNINNNTINNIESFIDANVGQTTSHRQSTPSLNTNNENDINYRSTLTLSRVAFLYRQLEALEDSMRHTSFSPYINASSVDTSAQLSDLNASRNTIQENGPSNETNLSINDATSTSRELPPMYESSQNRIDQLPQQPTAIDNQADSSQQAASRTTTRAPNNSEPFVVSFDEFLESLHLIPLVVDGQIINPASVIEQYPIDLPYQLHYMMQFESINQVNQNFIRISKLMSSVRLYRQIVQQILSNTSGQGHYQPNQILTAQSVSPRSSRHASNLPIVFHNVPLPMSLSRESRSTDPIIAIQFRNSARNVPLVTICKIDLLSSRSLCIMRSQQLIEQMILSSRLSTDEQASSTTSTSTNLLTTIRSEEQLSSATLRGREPSLPLHRLSAYSVEANPSYYPLLNQLHQSLSVINHAPLTTSNVHTHISSLRSLINKLLTTLSSMFQTQEQGLRLNSLIHDIACSLTGRSWNIPLGANLNDIRLDVIHTLCLVDLTLHLTRQVQLLQMQRLSAAARIEESRRAAVPSLERGITQSINNNTVHSSSNTNTQSIPVDLPSVDQVVEDCLGPSTSKECSNNSSKRKDIPVFSSQISETKKRKIEEKESDKTANSDVEMMEDNQQTVATSPTSGSQTIGSSSSLSTNSYLNSSTSLPTHQQTAISSNEPTEGLPHDRLVIWNSATQPQSVEQSLQRFLVATAASLNNNHILVRIYHRLHGSQTMPTTSILDQSIAERQSNPPYESRRRALSQDNAANSTTASLASPDNHNSSTGDHARSRAPFVHPVISSSDGWQRHPHLHVYQTRGTGQHLWFNQWTIPLPVSNSNYRLQCWNFSSSSVPNIKDSQSNIVTQKCRIHNDASIDISGDGSLIACLVPQEDGACLASFDLKIFSLKSYDFGSCYYQLPHGPNAISVSLSPSAGHAVVGLANNKVISNNLNEDDLTIAKVFKLNGKNSIDYVRDIKIKRDDSSLSLNAIRWMSRGIVYNVGPQHHQRYQATRLRHRVA